jgi:PAS domain S-box-containing protein
VSHSEASAQDGHVYVLKARELVGDCYEQLQTVLDNVNDYALFLLDDDGHIISWNKGAARETGYAEHEVLGRFYGLFFTPEDQMTGIPECELALAKREGRADDTRWLVCKDGTRFWAEGALTAIRTREGELKGFFKVSRNATQRKQFEEALKETNDRLTLALRAGQMGTWRWEIERDADVLDESMAALCGLKRETTTLAIREFYALVHESDRVAVKDAFERSIRDDADFRLDFRVIWPDKSVHWLTDHWRRGKDADGQTHCLAGACMDISDRKMQEQKLTASVNEKELLLKEIHHRVKNNLNVVTSLVSIQADYTDDPAVLHTLAEVQDRVRAIAGLHETLYSSPDLANIHFGKYLDHLLRELDAVYNVSKENIELRMDPVDMVLAVGQALPLGLIVNELVCNAFKHAFPEQRKGTIDVCLRYAPHDGVPSAGELIVRDDGVRMAGDRKGTSPMGTQLVTLLVQQLNGMIMVNHHGGTEVAVRFPLNQ